MVEVTVGQDYGVNFSRWDVHGKPGDMIEHHTVIEQNLGAFRFDINRRSSYFSRGT